MKLRVASLFVAFSSGIVVHASYPYLKAYLTQQNSNQEHHSFSDMMKLKEFSQPKIIDFLHNSPDKHFLHNLIAQSDSAMNVFKVYYPNQVEEKLFLGNELEDKHKLHLHLVFNASDHLQGHSSVVHGGLLATLIDNAFGQLSTLASGFQPTATANLTIDYKKPVKINEDHMITCEVDRIEGRKIFVKATIFDKHHNVCTKATGLFLTVQWGKPLLWKSLIQDSRKQDQQNQNQKSA